MPQKQSSFVLGAARAAKKTFNFLIVLGWIFSNRFLFYFH
jgi:hypothetical protein